MRLFERHEDLDAYLDSDAFTPPVDHTLLLQEYVAPAEPHITRVEVVGERFLYALTADTSEGFELCPADPCDAAGRPTDDRGRFRYRADLDAAAAEPWVAFAARWGIEIAGFEFIESVDGRRVTCDVNTNTKYTPVVERAAPRSGPAEITRFLGRLLAAERRVTAA